MKIRLLMATTNQGKVRELEALLAEPRVELVSLRDAAPADFEVEETGVTFEENAWIKASAACRATGLPALADDSGLEVDALGGRPGVYSARYAGAGAGDEANNRLLLEELADVPDERRTARFVAALSFAEPTLGEPARVAEARGVIEGRIQRAPRGAGGFGYDPLFEPFEFPGRTTAEMTREEKNRISHRARAVEQLRGALARWLDERATR